MNNTDIIEVLNGLLEQQKKLEKVVEYQNDRIREILQRQLTSDKVLHRIETIMFNISNNNAKVPEQYLNSTSYNSNKFIPHNANITNQQLSQHHSPRNRQSPLQSHIQSPALSHNSQKIHLNNQNHVDTSQIIAERDIHNVQNSSNFQKHDHLIHGSDVISNNSFDAQQMNQSRHSHLSKQSHLSRQSQFSKQGNQKPIILADNLSQGSLRNKDINNSDLHSDSSQHLQRANSGDFQRPTSMHNNNKNNHYTRGIFGTQRTNNSFQNKSNESRKRIHSIPKDLLHAKILLRVHEQNVCLNQFRYQNNDIVTKFTGHYQLLMDKSINIEKSYFQIKIIKSTSLQIYVGLATEDRLNCTSSYNSEKIVAMNLNNSFIHVKTNAIRNRHIPVKNGSVIKVEIENGVISWFKDKIMLGKITIPHDLTVSKLYPYIELYSKQDRIELL